VMTLLSTIHLLPLNATPTIEVSPLSLHDALPISERYRLRPRRTSVVLSPGRRGDHRAGRAPAHERRVARGRRPVRPEHRGRERRALGTARVHDAGHPGRFAAAPAPPAV